MVSLVAAGVEHSGGKGKFTQRSSGDSHEEKGKEGKGRSKVG